MLAVVCFAVALTAMCLFVLWIIYELLEAPLCDDDGNVIGESTNEMEEQDD